MTLPDDPRLRAFARDMAQRLRRLERGQAAQARAQDARHTAIDAGEGIRLKDGPEGPVLWQLGKDPATGVTAPQYSRGPKPAQPSAPLLASGAGSVLITLDGLDVNGSPAPGDFKHARVHLSTEPDFTPSTGTLRGIITDPHGSDSPTVATAGDWFVRVEWVTLSGQVSDPSEAVMVDVEPLVDTEDLKATLAEAQTRLDAAKGELEAAQQALADRTEDAETRLNNAEAALSEAEAIISPLPAAVEAAATRAENAENSAIAAEARATEANNRAMSRLANGNFEQGALYWESVAGAELTTDSHSGGQAMRLAPGARIIPESAMPVVEGQIWELQLYAKPDAAPSGSGLLINFARPGQEDSGPALLNHYIVGAPENWSTSGPIRMTVPADVDQLSFRAVVPWAETVSYVVDDFALRDVTDVVRLEIAAQEAKKAGEDALAEARLLALAVKGEGGLTDRLDTAETELDKKAAQSDLNELSGVVGTLNQTTLPGLGEALDDAKERLDTIEPVVNTTLPNAISKKLDQATGSTGNRLFRDVASWYKGSPASFSESIVIQTTIPVTSAIMARIKIEGAELSRMGQISAEVSFYAYSAGGGTIHSPAYTSDGARQVRIRLATDANENIAIILDPIGDYATTWAYPRITVTEYQMGYTNRPETAEGWSINAVADLSVYTRLAEPFYSRDLDDSYNLTQEWRTTNGGRTLRGDKLEANSVKALQIDGESVAGKVGTFLNLFVDQLTARDAQFDTGVLNKLWSELGVFGRVQALEGLIGGVNLAAGAVTAEKMTVTDDLITDILGANYGLFKETLIAQGDFFAGTATMISAVMENMTVTEKATFAEAFANQFWAKMAVIEKLQAQSAWIGGALLKDNEITVAKLKVTTEMVAELLKVRKIQAGDIAGNAFQGQTFTGGTFTGALFESIAQAMRGVKMDDQGFRAYRPDGTRTFDVDALTGLITALGLEVRDGTIIGSNVVGGYIGTANTGRRVFMQGDSVTAKNENEVTTAKFGPDGIELQRPNEIGATPIGPHVFGSEVITASTGTLTSIPTPSSSGSWGDEVGAAPSQTMVTASMRYKLDFGLTFRPGTTWVNANQSLHVTCQLTDANGVPLTGANIMSRYTTMTDVQAKAPWPYYFTSIVDLTGQSQIGQEVRLKWGVRVRGMYGGYVTDINMTMTPA